MDVAENVYFGAENDGGAAPDCVPDSPPVAPERAFDPVGPDEESETEFSDEHQDCVGPEEENEVRSAQVR